MSDGTGQQPQLQSTAVCLLLWVLFIFHLETGGEKSPKVSPTRAVRRGATALCIRFVFSRHICRYLYILYLLILRIRNWSCFAGGERLLSLWQLSWQVRWGCRRHPVWLCGVGVWAC